METGNFTVSIPVSIWSRIIPEFRFTQQISGSFHFQNGFFSGKMETLLVALSESIFSLKINLTNFENDCFSCFMFIGHEQIGKHLNKHSL